MVNAQEWLENQEEYNTKEKREKAKELSINNKELEGELDLRDFVNLKSFICYVNQLTSLDLSNCSQLTYLDSGDNLLTSLDLKNNSKLEKIYIWSNNFSFQDLSFLSHLVNLEELCLGNGSNERIQQGIYNRFLGSLKFSENLNKLKRLSINNTDINSGLEYLPSSLETIECSDDQKPDAGVSKIRKQLASCNYDIKIWRGWIKRGFNGEEIEQWKKAGLKLNQWDFADYLRHKSYNSTDAYLDLKSEYQNWLTDSGKSTKTYTFRELQEKVKQGKIDRRATVKMKSKNNRVVTMLTHVPDSMWDRIELIEGRYGRALWGKILGNEDSQRRLIKGDGTFISEEILEQFKKFSDGERKLIVNNSVTGEETRVRIKDLTFSESHRFEKQEIVRALKEDRKILGGGDYGYAFQSKEAFQFMKHIVGHWINSINLLKDKEFSFQEIDSLYWIFSAANYRNNYLVEAEVDSKANKEKIEKLIETDIQKERESLEKIGPEIINQIKDFSNYWDLTSEKRKLINKLMPNKELKRRYKAYGLCLECNQPNSEYKWCQFCDTKRLKQDFDKWTSDSEKVDEYIQGSQSKATSPHRMLEWIPYNRIENVEYLAEGGFSKIYKAIWIDGYINYWNIEENEWKRGHSNQVIALKVLKDSQKMDDFLQEIANHGKLFSGRIVKCYGISKEPETKNYVMILDYVPGGSLRRYIKDKYKKMKDEYEEMSFEEKFAPLQDIALGLKYIHKKGLIHKDFHPGNILSSFEEASRTNSFVITDLGLSGPAGKKEEENIYGVLPYVAPEVLSRSGCTSKADIYSWSMIAYEVLTGLPPYYDLDLSSNISELAIDVCDGKKRPEFNIKIPQLLEDLIKKCWNKDPKQRPSAKELEKTLESWYFDINDERDTEFYQQYLEAEEFNEKLPYEIRFPSYNLQSLTSKPINTNLITQLLRNLEKVKLKKELEEINKELEEIKNSLDNESTELIGKFVEIKKESIKCREDKQIKKQVRELKKQLEEDKGFTEEKINNIICHCEKLVELEQKAEQEKFQAQVEVNK